jgi:hypothetical protein
VNPPDLTKMNVLVDQLKKIYEVTARDSENFTGDAVLSSEENLKKGERCLFLIVQLSTKIINRHEPAKEQEKIDKYMRYETLQFVSKTITVKLSNF